MPRILPARSSVGLMRRQQQLHDPARLLLDDALRHPCPYRSKCDVKKISPPAMTPRASPLGVLARPPDSRATVFTGAAATVASDVAGSPPSARTCRLSACWRASSVKAVRRSPLTSWRLTTTVKSSGLPTTRASRSPGAYLALAGGRVRDPTVSIFVPDGRDGLQRRSQRRHRRGQPTVAEPPEMRCTSAM